MVPGERPGEASKTNPLREAKTGSCLAWFAGGESVDVWSGSVRPVLSMTPSKQATPFHLLREPGVHLLLGGHELTVHHGKQTEDHVWAGRQFSGLHGADRQAAKTYHSVLPRARSRHPAQRPRPLTNPTGPGLLPETVAKATTRDGRTPYPDPQSLTYQAQSPSHPRHHRVTWLR